LGKRKRISRKELKHDPLLDSASKVTRLVEHHLPKVLIGLVALVVVILVSMMVVRARRATELDAAAALTSASQALNSGLIEQAAQQMAEVVRDYPGTRSAGAATCYLGTIAYEQGNLDEALQHFEEYLSRYGGTGNLRLVALEGKASVHEQHREFALAAQVYRDLASEARDVPEAFSRFMLNAMRCYRSAADWENTRLAATEIIEADPESHFAGEARVALAEAEARASS
jgi:outer membrane protein assembly factor BamD (BamD/ComL family)